MARDDSKRHKQPVTPCPVTSTSTSKPVTSQPVDGYRLQATNTSTSTSTSHPATPHTHRQSSIYHGFVTWVWFWVVATGAGFSGACFWCLLLVLVGGFCVCFGWWFCWWCWWCVVDGLVCWFCLGLLVLLVCFSFVVSGLVLVSWCLVTRSGNSRWCLGFLVLVNSVWLLR